MSFSTSHVNGRSKNRTIVIKNHVILSNDVFLYVYPFEQSLVNYIKLYVIKKTMKLSKISIFAAMVCAAFGKTIKFVTESDTSEFNDKGLYLWPQQKDIYSLGLTPDLGISQVFDYDEASDTVTIKIFDEDLKLGTMTNSIDLSKEDKLSKVVKCKNNSGYLEVGGTTDIVACGNSERESVLALYQEKGHCKDLRLKIQD